MDGLMDLARTTTVRDRAEVLPCDCPFENRGVGEKIHDQRSRYEHNLAYVDTLVGSLLSALDGSELASHTYVALCGDHGEGFEEHGSRWHGRTQYEEVTRVPLIIRCPQGPHAVTLDQPCSLIDLAPTLLDLVDARKPQSFSGKSFAAALLARAGAKDGQSAHSPEAPAAPFAFCSEYLHPPDRERKAIRYGTLKCISAGDGRKVELYDLAKDPAEKKNLAAAQPKVLASMLQRLDEWQREQKALAQQYRGALPDSAEAEPK